MFKKVLLGMSGGVDSSYSVLRLRDMGYEVEGAILVMSDATDISSAQKASEEMSVPLSVIDCRREFSECVISKFADEYLRGRTPNPCVDCNVNVKFANLLKTAEKLGIDKISTGHYAKVGESDGRYFISRGDDSKKDQSYMLYRLGQDVLSRLVLPLGEISKTDVRKNASDSGLSSSSASDSNEICFIPDNNHAAYIEKLRGIKSKPGNFVDLAGNVLGRHEGIEKYTIGQRKGLGISLGRPAFVYAISPRDNTVTLLSDENLLYSYDFICDGLSFMKCSPDTEITNARYDVKIRYAAYPVGCSVTVRGGFAKVKPDFPLRAVTPGQSAVFYDDNDVAFGGFIRG